ncbi:undecaprenyldiphospho-muramoylpentapeptide beta-N-acetylglucosaminyltransferase [Indioceanicola profundi]|uniref:undecaprenyldiphospho-muramoylpentapeptide beta-N-acetylglucosaminyltransferase n=1 Tax=Indioceanicola profundi TaxID=2220096 RepID=UPI000E6AA9F9|nr:undecaprenyldiphospho-muramoylpentapeptide beta-N-acetylglucosaminyltransferase [Indioceanicola profundi]
MTAASPLSPIVLAAGGTGGHMFPAEALARELLVRGREVVLITDTRGKAFGDALGEVRVERIRAATVTAGIAGKLRMVTEIGIGTWQARGLLKRLRPALVVGFGGYPSVPTVFAAQRLGIPVVLHEQNAVLGRANRMLAKKAHMICTSFEHVSGVDAADSARLERTGNPVRAAIVTLRDRPYPEIQPGGSLNILVTGGSQGASIFGEVLPRAVAMLDEDQRARLSIVQQARTENLQAAAEAYRSMGVQATLAPFFKDMPERLAACHLMICRSGASTVAELTVAGRPAILVPYPHATDDHQTANARAVEAAGGAWLMPNPQFTAERLAARLNELLADPMQLPARAHAARIWGIPDAGQRLADAVLSVAGTSTGANGNSNSSSRETAA